MRFLGNRPRAFPYESTFTCSRFHNESGRVPYAAMRWRICDTTSLPYMRVPIPIQPARQIKKNFQFVNDFCRMYTKSYLILFI